MLIVSEETGPGRSSGRLTYIMKDSPDFEAVKRIMTERYGEGRLEINGDGRAGYRDDRSYTYRTEDKTYYVIAAV